MLVKALVLQIRGGRFESQFRLQPVPYSLNNVGQPGQHGGRMLDSRLKGHTTYILPYQ